jgi:pre-mRNA-processing factor 19
VKNFVNLSAVVNSILVNKVVPPRPTTATSIPAMLSLFQNEWDAVMLETYSLKQQLDSVSDRN